MKSVVNCTDIPLQTFYNKTCDIVNIFLPAKYFGGSGARKLEGVPPKDPQFSCTPLQKKSNYPLPLELAVLEKEQNLVVS